MKSIYFILNKCLHYLLAIQVLNLSFGNLAMEGHVFSDAGTENNQIDSAIEFITEHILGWNDFIPEQHKSPQDRHFLKVNSCSLFCEKGSFHSGFFCGTSLRLHVVFIPGSLSEYDREINPPPPKYSI